MTTYSRNVDHHRSSWIPWRPHVLRRWSWCYHFEAPGATDWTSNGRCVFAVFAMNGVSIFRKRIGETGEILRSNLRFIKLIVPGMITVCSR